MPTPEQVKQEIEKLLRANQKMLAIKYARESFNVSLQEAVKLVEAVEKELGIKVGPSPGSLNCLSGCLTSFAWFFFACSFLMFSVAGVTYYLNEKTIQKSERIIGTVVALESNSDNGDSQAPVIAYEWKGEERKYHSTVYSDPPEYYVGEEVELYIDPEDPEEVIVDTFLERWLVVSIMGGAGLFLLIFSIVFRVANKVMKKTPNRMA